MFSKIYKGSLKVLYILTSQMNPYSDKYDDMLKVLLNISKKYGNEIPIVIVPNDDIARKLGIIRNKKLRRFRTPEVKFLDFNKLVSTEAVDGVFPITDCTNKDNKCHDLIDTHYTRKNTLDKVITEENLEEFIQKSLIGEYEQYYELDTTPCAAVRKLCGRDFVKEVIESDKDVIVEFYGKYCPGCNAFKKSFNDIAQELQVHKETLTVARICIDHNMIPEISEKKPFTPIFWYYKKGKKNEPVQYKGKIDKEKLLNFIQDNLTQEQSS